jgi:tetratricopeptide (TPR) repeat protein
MRQTLLLVLLLGLVYLVPAQSYPANYYRSLGLVNYYERNFLEAVFAFQKAVAIDPADKEVLQYLAATFDSIGNKDLSGKTRVRMKAISTANFSRSGAKEVPSLRNNFLALGNEYYNKEQYDSSVICYRYHLRGNKEDTAAIFYLANSFFFLKEYDSSTYYYSRLLHMDKSRSDVYNLMGVSYEYTGDLLSARDYYKQCILRDPEYGIAYLNLGKIHFTLENYERAIFHLEKANRLMPKNKESVQYLAKAYMNIGDKGKALVMFEKMYATNKKDEALNASIGTLYYEAGQYAKSAEHLQTAYIANPKRKELARYLGFARLYEGKSEEAFQVLQPLATNEYTDAELLYNTSKAANDTYRYNEAIEYANRATTIDSNYKNAYLEIGKAYKGLKKRKKAKEFTEYANSL